MAYEIFAEDSLTGTAASIDLTAIPQTSTHLELVINARSTRVNAYTSGGEMTFNGDTGATYGHNGMYLLNSTTPSIYNLNPNDRNQIDNPFRIVNDSMTANLYAQTKMIIPNYTNTSITRKGVLIQTGTGGDSTSAYWTLISMASWSSTAAITQITMFSEAVGDPFKAGTSYYLAGWE